MSAHVGRASHPRGTARHRRSRQVVWGGMGVPVSWHRSRGLSIGSALEPSWVTGRSMRAPRVIVAPCAALSRASLPPRRPLPGQHPDTIVHQTLIGRVRGEEAPTDHPGSGAVELLFRVRPGGGVAQSGQVKVCGGERPAMPDDPHAARVDDCLARRG